MIKYNIYIITCDKSNWILNVTIPLLEKYWNIKKSVKILGFSKPNITLPIDYEFISMKPKQESIDDWANDIYSIMSKDENEHILFMLDDFLPFDYLNVEMLNFYIDKMINDENIVRCGLGSDMQFLPHTITEKHDKFSLIELNQNSEYRISTQPSLWKKDYFLKYLKQSKNPWHFETNCSPSDGYRMISTINDYCYYYICESALSNRYPGMVNILGMKFEDLKQFIGANILQPERLQFGMHYGRVPQFINYQYGFNIDILRNYVPEQRYNEYKIKYNRSYEN